MSATSAPPATTAPARRAPREARLWRWHGRQLDPRDNSLNLIRLVLASSVLFHHAYPLGGFEGHPEILGTRLGGWAVFGFFCISGYLITGSRQGKALGPYLVHRAARIYPAFWVSLVVVAALFAPIDYARTHGTLDGFLTAGPITPLNHIVSNFTLRIGAYPVGDTLAGNPYPSAWNGSLWTLYYEFLCYLIIGVVAAAAWWRRSAIPCALALATSVVLFALWPTTLSVYVGGNPDVGNLLQLLPFFLGGALVHALRDRLPLHWLGALATTGVVVVAAVVQPTWGLQAAAPFFTYTLLWIGSALRAPRWFQVNDVSYGMYIYAFPVQQLFAALGATRWGLWPYVALTLAGTIPLAVASWFLVERPVMRRTRGAERRVEAAVRTPAVVEQPAG